MTKSERDEPFVDPRLKAKETLFEQLHLSTFDTMSYAQAVMQAVRESSSDIPASNEDFQQLVRDYQVTRNLTRLDDTPLIELSKKTDAVLDTDNIANANLAQICAAAANALNHWRILCEIPEDLLENPVVAQTLKDNFNTHKQAWVELLKSLNE